MKMIGGRGIQRAGASSISWRFLRLKGLQESLFLKFALVFALIALGVSLAVGFILSGFLASEVRNNILNNTATDVSQHTASIIASRLSPEQLAAPMTGQSLQEFDAFIKESILSPRVLRVNVWNREGTVIYSTNPDLQGETFDKKGVEAALAGETEAEVEEPEAGVEGQGLEAYDQIMKVYTPLLFPGSSEPTGAIEVYRDFGPVAAHIADMQRGVYIGIAAALAFIYLSLLFVVKRGSDLIRKQQGDLQERTDELKSSYDSIVSVLCAALDLRDHVTHGQAQRVLELASVVAWEMGLRKEQVRQIEQAAILHDIGKIGVADAVLSKPGPLTEEEWEEMRRHPELGYQILKDIEFLKDAAEVVYAHHERYDGSGYPRGLRGDEIPLGARIFAVVDAYDAMTSHRPYRKPVSHQEAVEEIRRNAGTQFDPQVVKAFLEAEQRGLLEDRRETADDVETFFARVTGQGRRRPSSFPAQEEASPATPPEVP